MDILNDPAEVMTRVIHKSIAGLPIELRTRLERSVDRDGFDITFVAERASVRVDVELEAILADPVIACRAAVLEAQTKMAAKLREMANRLAPEDMQAEAAEQGARLATAVKAVLAAKKAIP